MNQFLRRLLSAGLLVVALALQGCAQPPQRADSSNSANSPVSQAFVDTADTALGRSAGQMAQAHPGKSGVIALPYGMDAYAARARLADVAERSLDVQYYIWHNDVSGNLLLDALRRAADRGVRVRLLLDDNNTGDLQAQLKALSGHPNLEVRLFNPYRLRGLRALDFLFDFGRLNRRMHNKSFTADNQVTVVGGRNVGDEYFDVAAELEFLDLDVMAIGQVVRDVSRDFDRYWASESAIPAEQVLGRPAPGEVSAAPLPDAEQVELTRAYLEAVAQQPFVKDMLARRLVFEWANVQLVSDDPSKGLGHAPADGLLWTRLLKIVPPAKSRLDVVSPYFVPGDDGVELFVGIARRGVQVTILTNSLAATDVVAVHTGYARRRKPLLQGGVRLLEIQRDPASPLYRRFSTGSSSASSLHAKTFSLDRSVLFVGSFNFDPRSAKLNTEMGLVIESQAMASAVSDAIAGPLTERSYIVRLRPDGAVEWVERTADGVERVWDEEPATSTGRRLGVKVLSLLPIEWLL
jgi:putative cardiolipin synthase